MAGKANGAAGPARTVAPPAEEKPEKGQQESAQAKLEAFLDSQAKELTIDELQLNEEFKSQARKFLQAAQRHNKAVHVLALVEAEVEALESEARGEFEAGKEKKPTEGQIAGHLAVTPGVQVARRKLAFAKMQAAQYQSVVRAWEHKRDMLVQMGSTQRAEMQAGISITDGGRPPAPKAGNNNPRPRSNHPAMQDDYFGDET